MKNLTRRQRQAITLYYLEQRKYEDICRKEGLIDFDDMILMCGRLLYKHEKILRKWQDRFRYILVDEFQDINEFCIKQLELKHASIVGTREFLSFIENTSTIQEMCRKNDLSPIVVWTEIRGLIKLVRLP